MTNNNTNKNFQPYAPEVSIGTFFDGNGGDTLVEIIVWNGRYGFKFKRIARDANNKYDKDASVEVKLYPKSEALFNISKTIDKILEDRLAKFYKGESYSDLDRAFEYSSESYDVKTGEKIRGNTFSITTAPDPSGTLRIVISGQNNKDKIDVTLFSMSERLNMTSPAINKLDISDLPLMKFGKFMKDMVSNSNAAVSYQIGKAMADYIIYNVKRLMGGGSNGSNSQQYNGSDANEYDYNASTDEDVPF